MRILVITPYFYPHPGGSQQYIEGLYSALKKLQPELEVDVLCYNTDAQTSTENHGIFTIYRVPCVQLLYGQFAIPNYFEMVQLLKRLKKQGKTYDFVNAHTRFFESSWWAPFVARYFNAKSIFTDHCASHPWHPNVFVRTVTRILDRLIVPFITPKYNYATTVCEATKDFLESLGSKKVDAVIYCGVNAQEKFLPRKLDPEKFTVGFVGRG